MQTQTATPATLSSLPDLVALRVSNGALAGDKLPTRIKVLNWGDNPSTKGVFKVGPKTVSVLAANQSALGFDRVAIDYNHTSAPGAPDYVKGAVPPIFGYGRVNVLENDGLYLEDVTWTPLGLQHARNFEDLSPALFPSAPGAEVEFVHSVALTTNGALRDVSFFTAQTKNNSSMNTGNPSVLTLALLAGAFALPETATEDLVVAKLKNLAALEPLAGLLKDGQVVIPFPDLATLSDQVKAIGDQVESLRTQLSTLNSSASDRERAELLARLNAEGKAPKNAEGKEFSAEELGKMELGTLRLLYANTPVTVPLSARGKATVTGGASTDGLKGLAKTTAVFQAQFDQARQRLN